MTKETGGQALSWIREFQVMGSGEGKYVSIKWGAICICFFITAMVIEDYFRYSERKILREQGWVQCDKSGEVWGKPSCYNQK